MKYITPVCISLLLLIFSNISAKKNATFKNSFTDTIPQANKKSAQNKKELIYDFPDEVTTDTGRISFVKNFKKGRILYTQTCAKCHNVIKDKEVFYPDFSLPQLLDYEMRFQYPQHQEDLKETNITHDELDLVVIFLRYKKKNLPVKSK